MQLQQYGDGHLYIVLNVYIKRKKSPQISNLTLQLRTPETNQSEHTKPKANKTKEMIKIRSEISEIENRDRQKQ